MSTNPYETPPAGNLDTLQWPMAIGLAILGVALGGYLCGCAIDYFGSMGSISIWALGGVLGWAAGKFLLPKRSTAYVLVGAVVLSFFVAETCWIKWNIVGVKTWGEAIEKLPLFFQTYRVDGLVAGLMTFFGANSTYRQASR